MEAECVTESENLGFRTPPRENPLNLTQNVLEVVFMAEAAAVAAESIGHKECCFGRFQKPVAAVAELAARLSKQPRTAAAAD